MSQARVTRQLPSASRSIVSGANSSRTRDSASGAKRMTSRSVPFMWPPSSNAGIGRASNVSGATSIVSQSMRNSLNVRQASRSRHQARTYHDDSLNTSCAGSTVRSVRLPVASKYANDSGCRPIVALRMASNAAR